MSQIVDTLVTRYTLDAKGYLAGSRQVTSATKETARAMTQGQSKLSGFAAAMKRGGNSLVSGFKSLGLTGKGILGAFSAVGSAVSTVISMIMRLATVAVGAAGALAALAYAATNQYAEFESIKLTFAGIADSLEKAEQMMRAIKSYSLKSVFDEEPLARAALQLTQLNLRAGEFLPIIESIAMRSGEITPDKLLEVVSILRRLKGGQIADALGPEGLGRFGIGKQELAAYGAIVDASGEFKMNTEQALQVLKNLANSPEAERIRTMLEGSPQTRISNALGALAASFREFGAMASQFVIPALETVGNVAQFLVESGWFRQLASDFSALFGENDQKKGFLRFLFTVVSAFEVISSYVVNVAQNASKALGVLHELNLKYLQGMTLPMRALLWAIDKVRGTDLVGELDKMLSRMSGVGLVNGPLGQLFGLPELGKAISDATDAKMAGFEAWQKQREKKGDAAFPDLTKPEAPSPVEQALTEIAGNTAETASNTQKQLDMQRYVLGGGDLGRLGVTPVEMSGRSREVSVKVSTGDSGLDEWVTKLLNRTLRELRRRGEL